MIERPYVEDILELNAVLCDETGEPSACLDMPGLEAAVERPWAGFGEEEFYPTLCDKAAALLHGIASRQVFENGNKRTAWAAAAAFLDTNGIDIGHVETVQADMFVRAAALDHSLAIDDLAEWFEVAAAGGGVDPRISALLLANAATVDNGLLHIQGGGWTHYTCLSLPSEVSGSLCGLIDVAAEERDSGRVLVVSVEDRQGQDLGFRASVLAAAPTADGPSRLPFAVEFRFVVEEPLVACFRIADAGGSVLAEVELPIRGPLVVDAPAQG